MKLHQYLMERDLEAQKDRTFIEKMTWAYEVEVPSNLTLFEVFNKEIHSIITYTEECMFPDFKPGSKLCLSQIVNMKTLVWGETYYFIDVNNRGLLRRVYITETGTIRIVSNNPDKHPEIIRKFDELQKVFEIVGVLLK
jgi:hypothetical protein